MHIYVHPVCFYGNGTLCIWDCVQKSHPYTRWVLVPMCVPFASAPVPFPISAGTLEVRADALHNIGVTAVPTTVFPKRAAFVHAAGKHPSTSQWINT